MILSCCQAGTRDEVPFGASVPLANEKQERVDGFRLKDCNVGPVVSSMLDFDASAWKTGLVHTPGRGGRLLALLALP